MQGLLASLLAGVVTGVGGFMIFLKKKYSQENINCMLNAAAGVMLAASFLRCWCRPCTKSRLLIRIFMWRLSGFAARFLPAWLWFGS